MADMLARGCNARRQAQAVSPSQVAKGGSARQVKPLFRAQRPGFLVCAILAPLGRRRCGSRGRSRAATPWLRGRYW